MIRLFFAVIIALMSMTVMAKSIVVLGDSISAEYGIEVGRGWVSLVQNKLKEKNSGYAVHNESISGDTTAGGLARIDKVLARHQPEIVLLELGGNDGLRGIPPKVMKNNLAEIVRRAQKADAKVLLLAMKIPPNYGKRYVDMFYDVYPQLSAELDIPYIPFILEDVALIKELMQQDGLHPNLKAQQIIADKVWPHLMPLLK
ncbi:multifunctional acyl-CoA thioesterase I and protease I and lysophospholipase L1 [Candidatus Methylobacter favarea]|uniref:Multifunctional acyl-CoA thioesterase I and protease I and lysophospholipase L1 n=1 Tax=Candidatus Methylobacter favarea TaxID=2707345 RepID=A0A8S0XGT4_9GAMM|nr:arylesterase [Candidatus Methylobacter favarea]CAA9891307.1 multifunctional acyl-CoA thioesterase I and protease I and lysophospholipase L1 [Candidatus Methylobacter favarea]